MRSSALIASALFLSACHAAAPPAAPPPNKAPVAESPTEKPAAKPEPSARREAAIEAILQAASPRVSSPAEAKRLLDDARARALPEEKPLLDHAESLAKLAVDLEKIAREPGTWDEKKARVQPLMEKILGGYADLLREARPIYPGDVDKQVMLAATLYTLADVDGGGGASHEAWRKEALGWTRELATKFPTSAKAERLLGSFCTHEDEDLTVCMKHFARCSELDPGEQECKEERARLGHLYTAPRCGSDAIRKELGVFTGTGQKKPGAREVDVGGAKAWLDPKPAFTSADFAAAETVYVRVADEAQGKETEAEEVYVGVKPERQAAFAQWLAREGLPKDAVVVVMRGNKLLASAPAGRLRDGKGMLLQAKADDVCTKTEKRALPGDLR